MFFCKDTSLKEFVRNAKSMKGPVVIFGAGVVAQALFYACRHAGIHVEGFCDNNINKTKARLCERDVIYVPQLKEKYEDALFLISAADIKDVIDQLMGLGYSRWYPGSMLLKDFDLSGCQFDVPMDFVDYAVGTCLLCHGSYLVPDKLFLRSVDIIITERCSLKCRDCSNLMQYYKKPLDCDTKEVARTIDMFCALADEINEFRVIGGEPFMNRESHLVVKRLCDEPKVKRVVIYTNGTIVPDERQIEYIKNDKVLVIITDYGPLSKKLDFLIETLQHNGIDCYAPKARGWTDCAKIEKYSRGIEFQKQVFKDCCAKNTFTLSKGRLYRCPFSANAARLLAVPDYQDDYIDFFQGPQEQMDMCEMKKRMKRFILEKDYLDSCDYCNGRSFGACEIHPAVQVMNPLVYEQHGA